MGSMVMRVGALLLSAWVFIASLAVAGALSRPQMADDSRPPVESIALYSLVPYAPSMRPTPRCARSQRGQAVPRSGDFVF